MAWKSRHSDGRHFRIGQKAHLPPKRFGGKVSDLPGIPPKARAEFMNIQGQYPRTSEIATMETGLVPVSSTTTALVPARTGGKVKPKIKKVKHK